MLTKDMIGILHLFVFEVKLCVQRLNNYFTNKQSKKQIKFKSY